MKNRSSAMCIVSKLLLCMISWLMISCNNGNQKQPNILIIITDDQDACSLETYGDTECNTPNIDRLSEEGITFTSAYHMGSYAGAVCRPSRAMIMTGQYVWRTQGFVNMGGRRGVPHEPNKHYAALAADDPEYNSIPAIFRRAEYETFRCCKWENSFDGANRLFEHRFDKSCRMTDDENGSKWHADHVIEFLHSRAERPEKKPFLVYLGFSHPHDPRHRKPELLTKYGAVDPGPPEELNPRSPQLPVNYLPEHPFFHGHPDLRDEYRVQGVMERRDEITIRNEIGKEFACIENIDIQIGRVLQTLAEAGELALIYFSPQIMVLQ